MIERLRTKQQIIEYLWAVELQTRQEYVDNYMKPGLDEEQRAVLRQKALDAKHILRGVIGKSVYANEVVARSQSYAAKLKDQEVENAFVQ